MATPLVPQRPARANGSTANPTDSIPHVPPRPIRKTDPSPSRSPLNELPTIPGSIRKTTSQSNLSPADVPPRPPSVSFPSVGQEGTEYASMDLLPPEATVVTKSASTTELGTPEQTRNVAADMPLHAPKASVPQSTAKSRIETVTGTDSTQAAAAGIGHAKPDDDVHKTPADSPSFAPTKGDELKRTTSADPAALRPRSSFSRPPSGAAYHSSRPASVYDDEYEHGIPNIGQQIPLLRNAGDVQAPSPGITMSQHTPGVGFFNDGSARAHTRRRSGKHDFGPPGSYGLHSHGADPHDQFERDWYAKHPDRAIAEGYNTYGRPKPESALSSAELNRIVTQTDDDDTSAGGVGMSIPGEEIGYNLSDAYSARNSPRTTQAPGSGRTRRPSSGSQPAVESPLRRTSYPAHGADHAVDDDGPVHFNTPEYRVNKYNGGGPADGAVDLGPKAGNTAEEGGLFLERGPGTPILASDEVLKRHESSYMQPAVNLEYHYDDYDSDHAYDSRRSSVRVPSRPSSRPGSRSGEYQGGNLHRYISHEEPHHGSGLHTPLEEIEEYEPLIPEGEDVSPRPKPKEVKKRPGLEHHHFPSRDIWEDTPSSLQFSTTVQTPDQPEVSAKGPTGFFDETTKEVAVHAEDVDDATGAPKAYVKPHYASRGIERPGAQRFPSKDIWEDTPSSLQFQTTVGTPEMDDSRSPPDDRPTTSSMPGSQDDGDARATTGLSGTTRPSIPARPKQRSKLAEEITPAEVSEPSSESREISEDQPPSPEKSKAPPIPDRPKPTVPSRPVRITKTDQSDGTTELLRTTSAEGQSAADSTTSPPPIKAKPAVPARPAGEKIAALKAGFMNDLNNRLKIGPSAPPTKSREVDSEAAEEAEKAPLADARKSRAKGPARRKPASAAAPPPAPSSHPPSFSMSTTFTMWAIDESEELQVPPTSEPSHASTVEKVLSDNTASNTDEPAFTEPQSPEKVVSPPPPSASAPSGEGLAATSSPEKQKSIVTKLEAELADVGAAPAPAEAGDEVKTQTVSSLESESVEERTSADVAVQEESRTVEDAETTS